MGLSIFYKKNGRGPERNYRVAVNMPALDTYEHGQIHRAKYEPEPIKRAAESMAKLAKAVKNYNSDMIHHQAHYCYSKYEPKDVIREWGLNFNLGSAVKYIARAGRKDDILQELKKAKQFLEFEIEAIEKERAADGIS